MTKKIMKLTAAQEARLIEFREEWLQIGLSCEPADFETGDNIIRGFYKRLGKPAPMILHFSSPIICELAVNFIFSILQNSAQLRSQLRSQLDSQLGSQLDSQLDSQLRSQLDSQLELQLDSQLGSCKPYFYRNRWGSNHWCYWEAWYLFAAEIGVKFNPNDLELLNEWASQSKSIGWWAPWDGICFVSDRPRGIHFDQGRRLHCETGKVAYYSDGWGCYSWHGTAIPGEWIENKSSLTAKEAITWPNIEQRRAAIEIFGWAKILNELDAKVINDDGDPLIGTLVEVKLPDIERPARFLRVLCGTGREFAVGVPHEVETALQAQAWMSNRPLAIFNKPEVRT